MTGYDGGIMSKQPRAAAKPVTQERLEQAALAYLQRFATSSENLRQVLLRRIRRTAELHGDEAVPSAGDVDALVGRYMRSGLLDDALYARTRAVALSRAGHGRRSIALKLRAKGLSDGDIQGALAALEQETGDTSADLLAALRHARRRRLGPFGGGDPARDRRDMAALARRGFSADIVMLIIGAEDEAALADRLTDRGIDLHALLD